MALIIEDGTAKPDSQSYATASEARDYAALRGVILDPTDGPVEILLVRAMDYLETQDYLGEKTTTTQALEWPRKGAADFAENEIPAKLKQAQMQLAMEAVSFDLMPSSDGRQVLREKVDVIETQYAQAVTAGATPSFPKVDALLQGLLNLAGGLGLLRTTRI